MTSRELCLLFFGENVKMVRNTPYRQFFILNIWIHYPGGLVQV